MVFPGAQVTSDRIYLAVHEAPDRLLTAGSSDLRVQNEPVLASLAANRPHLFTIQNLDTESF